MQKNQDNKQKGTTFITRYIATKFLTFASMLIDWREKAQSILKNETTLSFEEAKALLHTPPSQMPSLIEGAYLLRKHFWDNKVILNYLINAKCGYCSEDCHYCAQSRIAQTAIKRYPLQSKQQLLRQIEQGVRYKAHCICLVTSGKGPSDKEVSHIAEVIAEAKERFPEKCFCACMGLLSEKQAQQLKEAGTDKYNHNLNTSPRNYKRICSTHSYEDRERTLQRVKEAGMAICSGIIVGMGETQEELITLAFRLKAWKARSIPINFLIPIQGTPLGNYLPKLTPIDCLRILALFRFIHPEAEIRISAGREHYLQKHQKEGLKIANSIFIDGYLTVNGQGAHQDLAMLRYYGFEPF